MRERVLKKYKVEIDVLVNENDEQRIVRLARKVHFDAAGVEDRIDGGRLKKMTDVSVQDPEFEDVREALMELARRNPLLQQAKLKIVGVAAGPVSLPSFRKKDQRTFSHKTIGWQVFPHPCRTDV